MRHAVAGAGAVGGAVAAALARAGRPVTLLMRPPRLAEYGGVLRVESPWQDPRAYPMPAAQTVPAGTEVIWLTCKAHHLPQVVPALRGGGQAVIVPLVNGIGHLPSLRKEFGDRLIPGAVRVEAERLGTGHIRQTSLFMQVDLGSSSATAERVAADLTAGGAECATGDSPEVVLWRKLALLLPLALGTTAAGGPYGAARRDRELAGLMTRAAREICAVATATGAVLDPEERVAALASVPARTRTSLERDVTSGAVSEGPELIAPVLRLATVHAVPAPALHALVERVDRLRGTELCQRSWT